MDKQAYLAQIDRVIAAGPYKADWGSLSRHATPGWYQDAKLGIFIHWGIYSVPGYHNEWYSREMYDPKTPSYRYHVAHYGKPDQFGYKDFIPMFKGEKFDPAAWAKLFRAAGAQYVMPVAEHHDGFAMYQTDFNRWNSVEMGPHQDVLGRLKSACQGEGLVFCASNHRAEHYFFMNNGRRIPSDVSDPAYGDFYGPAKDSDALLSYKMSATANDCRTEGPTEVYQ
jgi:alpha-L-fucosidase